MMAPKTSSSALLPLLLLLPFVFAPLSSAVDITQALSDFPDFRALLTQTKLVDEINKQGTVTILAVDASGLGPTKGMSPDVLKRVLSVHVILDYYDTEKIQNLAQDSISLTTLYQTFGTAEGKQGFVNLSNVNHWIKFGSAVPGAAQDSELVEVVVSKPSTLSVLHVSSVIVPPGIDKVSPAAGTATPATTSPPLAAQSPQAVATPPSSPKMTTAPVHAPSAKSNSNQAPTAAPKAAPGYVSSSPADAPSGDDGEDEDMTPTGTPEAESPDQAESPDEAESPEAESPTAAAPAGKAPAATAPAASQSIASSPAASAPGPMRDGLADAPKAGTGHVAAASVSGVGMGIMGAILLGL